MTIYILLRLFLCQITLHFIETVAIVTVKGSTVNLVCPHTLNGTGTLEWLFKSTTTPVYVSYTKNEYISPYLTHELTRRLNVTGNHGIGEYHLNIFDIRDSDQGTYACFVSPYGDINTQNVTVIDAQTASNTDVVIGASIGVLVALMIVCIIIILVLKSKKRKRTQ